MSQVTWRAPDELVEQVRRVAARQGRSLNDYLTRLARAAVDPELAGEDVERLRERLARAGLVSRSGRRLRSCAPQRNSRAFTGSEPTTPFNWRALALPFAKLPKECTLRRSIRRSVLRRLARGSSSFPSESARAKQRPG